MWPGFQRQPWTGSTKSVWPSAVTNTNTHSQILLPLVELSNSIQHHATKLHWYGCQHGNVQDRQGQGCPTKAASYCHEGNILNLMASFE